MARIKIELPGEFSFSTVIPIRITDLNYGNHVGNDSILSILHEARVKFLKHHQTEELDFGGVGLIMSDVGIEFKNEAFYGDELLVSVLATGFSKVSFELYYKIEINDEKRKLIAVAKTGMICFDYQKRKIASVPENVKQQFLS